MEHIYHWPEAQTVLYFIAKWRTLHPCPCYATHYQSVWKNMPRFRGVESHLLVLNESIDKKGIISFSREGNGTPLSTLAWKIPWMEDPGRLQSMRLLRVGHDWATSLSLFTFMHWRGKWQPTPVFFPGESQGRGSLVGCRLWGCTVGQDWHDLAAVAVAVANKELEKILQICLPLSAILLLLLPGCDFHIFPEQQS